MGIKHVISLCNQVLWVTSKCGKTPENPENGMAAGFAKSIMRENPSLTFICLNLESTKYARQFISQIVDQISTTPSTLLETDLVEWNNTFHIPRVVEAPQVNKLLHSATYGYEPELVTVDETTQEPLEMTYVRGRLDSLHFIYDKSSLTPIADDEARVEVKSTGVNFRDVMNVLGQLPLGTLSCDFSGIVTESGNSSGVKKGDRICGLSTVSGGFKSIVRAKRSHIIKIPPNMSFAEASAIPLISSTAYYSLCIVAGLRAGESVLIHSAAGGVGQAAIQIAQWLGAVVYVTVSTTAKKQLLVDRYGIHPSHCFSSRSLLFAEQLMNQTKGRGVDVILNSLSGLALVETWRCIAPLGRFVEIGKRDMIASKDLPMDPFQRNVTYSSVDLSIIGKFNDGLMGQIMQRVEELIWDKGAGPLKPPYPLTSFKRSEAEDALRLLQTGQHTGKAVISWEQPDIIKVSVLESFRYGLS
jgi:NADPH:quinone reductase-like Zn-dependent oxidoreductase